MAVAAPADKRFRRSRVRPTRRRSPWVARALGATRLLVAVVVLGGAGWYAAQAVTDSTTLRVSEIHVRGNQHLARGEVLALLAGLEGQHVLQTDLEEWRPVCVLGTEIARKLFADTDPVGRDVRVNRTRLTVVGLLEHKPRSFDENYNDRVYIPLTTVLKRMAGQPRPLRVARPWLVGDGPVVDEGV